MPAISLPRPFEPTLTAFVELAPRTAAHVTKVVEELPEFTPMRRLVDAVADALPKKAKDVDAAALVSAVASLRSQLEDRDPKDVAESIVDASRATISGDKRLAAIENLARLLAADALVTLGRADDVITDHERVFSRARILTDVRPVFRDKPTETPTVAVIIEMLKIEYWGRGGSGRRSFYVALDEADLVGLRRVIDRALEKTETMKKVLSSAGLANYEHQEVRDGSDVGH